MADYGRGNGVVRCFGSYDVGRKACFVPCDLVILAIVHSYGCLSNVTCAVNHTVTDTERGLYRGGRIGGRIGRGLIAASDECACHDSCCKESKDSFKILLHKNFPP